MAPKMSVLKLLFVQMLERSGQQFQIQFSDVTVNLLNYFTYVTCDDIFNRYINVIREYHEFSYHSKQSLKVPS